LFVAFTGKDRKMVGFLDLRNSTFKSSNANRSGGNARTFDKSTTRAGYLVDKPVKRLKEILQKEDTESVGVKNLKRPSSRKYRTFCPEDALGDYSDSSYKLHIEEVELHWDWMQGKLLQLQAPGLYVPAE
jgi:hypothetical protein